MAEENPSIALKDEIKAKPGDDRFRAIFEGAGVGLVLIDEQCNIFDANETFCRIVGRDCGELIGTTCLEITHPEDLRINERVMSRFAGPGERTATFEKRYVRPDGDSVWVRINLSKIAFGTGERVLAVVEDISDRKATEAALLRSEERLRRVLETDAVGVIFFNLDGAVIDANQAFLDMTGYTREAIEQRELNWRKLTPPEWVAASEEQMAKLTATGKIGPYAKQYILADGSRRWMLFAGRDLGDGTIAEYCFDITEQKQLEHALRQSEQLYRSLMSVTDQVLYRHNADWSEMRQLSGGGFLADTAAPDPNWFSKYIHPDDRDHVWERIQEAIRSKTPFEYEHRVIREDGTRGWTYSRSVPMLDEHGEVIEWFGAASDVTTRKDAEEEVRRAGEEFSTLADNIPVLCWMAEADGNIFWYNRRWYEYTGASRETQQGWGWESVHDPEMLPLVLDRWKHSLASGEPFEMTFPLRSATGEFRPFLTRVVPIRDEQGRIARWFGTNVDIGDQSLAEEQLRESEERLRLAVDNAEVGFWDVEEGFGTLTWPARTKAMFGISPDVPVTMDDFFNGLHPDDLPHVSEAYAAAADPAKRALYDVEYRTIGKEDGVLRWVAAKGRGVFDGEGPDARCIRVIGTAIDISQRKHTEEALRQESHNLEVLNRTGAAIAGLLDLEKVVQLVTDAGVELTGAQFGAFFYNVANASGESYMLYTLSGVPRSAFERFPMPRNTKVFGPTFAGEGVVRSDDITKDARYGQNAPYFGMPEGHLPVVSYLAVPVISRTGEVVGGLFFGHEKAARFNEHHERLMGGIAAQAAIAIDNARLYGAAQHEIEQRVRAEEALTALNETLESRVADEVQRRARAEDVLRQAQKMETVGQLSGGIAHDFNNLLQVIHGNLSLLDRSIPAEEEKLRRSVGNALTGTERAAALTKRLLAFSRRQPLDPKPIDVNRLILDMIDLLQRTLGETIAVETNLATSVPNALVDDNQLENAILNLAINARDAMPRGGQLEIGTSTAEIDTDYVAANPEATIGRHVCITVRDSGHGMSEDVLNRAIEPFFSTKVVGQGTGLGLSMVYGFVRQSGGHLVLNSAVNQGTRIELYLPCSDGAAQAREAPTSVSKLPRGNGECVLVCEDDDDVRLFSTETLADLGYSVLDASDASDALEKLADKGHVDLLFTDVILPGGRTGADLAREARKLQPELKVLFTTGYARSALDKEQGSEQGVEVLLKPFGVEELALKIRQVLG